jgi:squalene-associated FAD-dependent desaturase
MKVVVVGGGLAGMAAALDLADSGHAVTLLEARPTLGGVVQTLPERLGDPPPPPDNGQHIALGCFTAYQEFLARVGKSSALSRARLELPVIDERGRVAAIRSGALGLLRYGHLTMRERLEVARVARSLERVRCEDVEDVSFGELLASRGQSVRAIEHFWDVFMRPALNLPCAEAGAAFGLFTVQTALFGSVEASDLLLPCEPLGEMHGEAGARTLAAAGAIVRRDARVAELDERAAVLADGEPVEGDAFVLALPPAESARLLEEPAPALEESPIVSVHLLFDRRLLEPPLAALLGSPAHWVFDRGRITGHDVSPEQYLTVVSSGVPDLLAVRGRELVDLMAGELTDRLGPAELLWSRISREPRATFAPRPGSSRLRPPAETARPNVVRAGAWIQSEWPATMEAAVRSGKAAARLVAERVAVAV